MDDVLPPEPAAYHFTYRNSYVTQTCCFSIFSGQAEDAAAAPEDTADPPEPESKRRKTDDGEFVCFFLL